MLINNEHNQLNNVSQSDLNKIIKNKNVFNIGKTIIDDLLHSYSISPTSSRDIFIDFIIKILEILTKKGLSQYQQSLEQFKQEKEELNKIIEQQNRFLSTGDHTPTVNIIPQTPYTPQSPQTNENVSPTPTQTQVIEDIRTHPDFPQYNFQFIDDGDII